MEEKHSNIRCEKGDIVRIKGLGETASVVFVIPTETARSGTSIGRGLRPFPNKTEEKRHDT